MSRNKFKVIMLSVAALTVVVFITNFVIVRDEYNSVSNNNKTISNNRSSIRPNKKKQKGHFLIINKKPPRRAETTGATHV